MSADPGSTDGADTRPHEAISVLVVDDEETFRNFLSEGISLIGRGRYEPVCARSVDEALELLSDREVGALVTDIRMPGKDGLQLLLEIKKQSLRIPTVVMTAYGSPSVHAEAARRGAIRYIEKPFRFEDLIALLDEMIDEHAAEPPRSSLDLIEVVEMLCVGGKDMEVTVRTEDGNGKIHINQGEIRHAEFLGREGSGAFYELSAYRRSQISTSPSSEMPHATITQPWRELTQEAWRRRTNPILSGRAARVGGMGGGSILEDRDLPVPEPFWSKLPVDEVVRSAAVHLSGAQHPTLISHDDEGGDRLGPVERTILCVGSVLKLGPLVGCIIREPEESWILLPLGRGRTLTALCDGSVHIQAQIVSFAETFRSDDRVAPHGAE